MGGRPIGSQFMLSEHEKEFLERIRAILIEYRFSPGFQAAGRGKYLNAISLDSQSYSTRYLGKLANLMQMSEANLRKHIEAKLAKRD